MAQIILGRYGEHEFEGETLKQIYQLRHVIFHDRLGWDVVSDHGMEYDFFDVLNPIYVLVKGNQNQMKACWRLLPTTGPYMLKEVFPQLLYDQPAPEDPNIWELSRFAISKSEGRAPSFGLGETSIHMLQEVVRFALCNGIARYLTVTTTAIERLMRRIGLDIHLYGPPLSIGNTMAVALWFDVNEHTEAAAFGQVPPLSREAA